MHLVLTSCDLVVFVGHKAVASRQVDVESMVVIAVGKVLQGKVVVVGNDSVVDCESLLPLLLLSRMRERLVER